jgi:hypothetical protein
VNKCVFLGLRQKLRKKAKLVPYLQPTPPSGVKQFQGKQELNILETSCNNK